MSHAIPTQCATNGNKSKAEDKINQKRLAEFMVWLEALVRLRRETDLLGIPRLS
jgi:hypothetical protein